MAEAGAPIIEAIGLTKTFKVAQKPPGFAASVRHFFKRTYKEIPAVTDVSFTIRPGEMVGFLGANGAGKTTTLKMLTGLLHPTAGRCVVDGREPFARTRDFLSAITLVMGNKQQLLWDLPARDTLRLNAAIYGISDADYKSRVDELSGMLELTDKLDQPVRKLSLGERMKAELLASLLHGPKVLFLDEPTLGLDVNAQVAVRAFLRRYNERTGATILMTSHYMADITALCSRVLVIHEGKLVHDGELAALLRRFGTRRELRVELSHAVDDAKLRTLGEVLSHEGNVARLAVEPAALVAVVGRALAELPVVDLTVHDPPIEEVVGRVIGKSQRALPNVVGAEQGA
ncbi:MAG: ATP-binding cassette domain-containing protein [Deltaproteobacteria bacterium]|nr:ATP-binding cassette domain-containing protein [Deltaproteobacteria bacterium]